jgi:hypothetical protein
MKLIILFVAVLIVQTSAFLQVDSLKTINLDLQIVVLDEEKVRKEITSFFDSNNIVPDLFNEYKNQFNTHFTLSESLYFKCVELIEEKGAIVFKKEESINYAEKLSEITITIERLEQEKKEYSELLQKIDVSNVNHVKYWEKLEEIKQTLRIQFKIKEEYEKSNKKFNIKLQVTEQNILTNEPTFSFVNMPGLQYSFLSPNSASTFFPTGMNGYSIKYLMNRRKTYLELGLFKSNVQNVVTSYDELYKFGLGQDFYSSHLGRGTRNFFNLYSGFNFGTFILTGGGNQNIISWYATPSIGLELYKNKYVLIDTKAGYFLPFKENRNMRGLLLEASFNIVF